MSANDDPAGEIPSGHRRIGCTGRWVDISTLTARNRVMCNRCRASRAMRPEEISSGDYTDYVPESPSAELPDDLVWTNVRKLAIAAAVVVVGSVAAFLCGVLVGIHWR